jgi:Tfp pilus assembly pilus retraction ATPase PilT
MKKATNGEHDLELKRPTVPLQRKQQLPNRDKKNHTQKWKLDFSFKLRTFQRYHLNTCHPKNYNYRSRLVEIPKLQIALHNACQPKLETSKLLWQLQQV